MESPVLLYIFRAIYDGDEHQKFMERLDARIKSHDRDIERMCNFHYQGFIDSIRELLQVRSQAKKLNVSISVKCVVLIGKCRLCVLTTVCLTISPVTVTCCTVNFVVCLSSCPFVRRRNVIKVKSMYFSVKSCYIILHCLDYRIITWTIVCC